VTNDKRGQQIHDAIARRDGAVLRTLAAEADREEGRMWLTLLARMLELDARRRDRQRVRTHNLPALPAPGRAAIRRAG
jgi:hypothetical protein